MKKPNKKEEPLEMCAADTAELARFKRLITADNAWSVNTEVHELKDLKHFSVRQLDRFGTTITQEFLFKDKAVAEKALEVAKALANV